MRQDRGPYIHLIILAAVGTALINVSWQRWNNLFVDYGRELYIPWRLAAGQVLYKDIAYLFGPFPPYLNAFLFKLFGTSIMTLAIFNIALVTGLTWLIYRFYYLIVNRWAALFAGMAFVSLFAFKQNLFNQGNYAYVCPYSHSVTYAVVLSFLVFEIFAFRTQADRNYPWVLMGFIMGLVLLSRLEIFIYLAAAVFLGLGIKASLEQWPPASIFKKIALLSGALILPVALAYGYFSVQIPSSQAWSGILGYNPHWPEVLNSYFYKKISGWDFPLRNFETMLSAAFGYALVLSAFRYLVLGYRRLGEHERVKGAVYILLGTASLGMAAILGWAIGYGWVFRGMPLAAIFITGYLLFSLISQRQDTQRMSRVLPLFIMALWALLMLSKVFLNVRIDNEGFVYAMPAVLLVVGLFTGGVPEHFERVYGQRDLARWLASVLCIYISAMTLYTTVKAYHHRGFRLRAGKDAMMRPHSPIPQKDAQFRLFLKEVDRSMGPNATFVVFPEGVMLNYLAKKTGPAALCNVYAARNEYLWRGRHSTFLPGTPAGFYRDYQPVV